MGLSLCTTNGSIKIFAGQNVYRKNEFDNHVILVFLLQFDADVLACNVDGGDVVVVLDTWNVAMDTTSNNRVNLLDGIMDTSPFTSSFVNGRITCQ